VRRLRRIRGRIGGDSCRRDHQPSNLEKMEMKSKDIKVGSIIALNTLPDAVWFDVVKINGFVLTIREHDTNYAEQITDKSLVKQAR
jgi:uncharacterized protein YtpQ (UPF0354 family)